MDHEVRKMFEPIHAATVTAARTSTLVDIKQRVLAFAPDAKEQESMLAAFTEALYRRYGEDATGVVLSFSLTAQSLLRLADGRQSDPIEGAEVTEKRGGYSTEYRITGSRAAVLAAVDGVFCNYHPFGYGTYLHAMSMETDGSYVARVSRSNSCD